MSDTTDAANLITYRFSGNKIGTYVDVPPFTTDSDTPESDLLDYVGRYLHHADASELHLFGHPDAQLRYVRIGEGADAELVAMVFSERSVETLNA